MEAGIIDQDLSPIERKLKIAVEALEWIDVQYDYRGQTSTASWRIRKYARLALEKIKSL